MSGEIRNNDASEYKNLREEPPEKVAELDSVLGGLLNSIPYEIRVNRETFNNPNKVKVYGARVVRREETPPGSQTTTGIILQENVDAVKIRSHMFRRFPPIEWSRPRYVLEYFEDRSEQMSIARDSVTFYYDPGFSIIAGGDPLIYEQLGLDQKDPLDAMIELARTLGPQ
jgi:hypothetical protein